LVSEFVRFVFTTDIAPLFMNNDADAVIAFTHSPTNPAIVNGITTAAKYACFAEVGGGLTHWTQHPLNCFYLQKHTAVSV